MPLIASLETPIGRLWMVTTDAGLFAIVRGTDAGAVLTRHERDKLDSAGSHSAARALRNWFDGASTELDVRLDLAGHGPFDRAVYAAARRIRYAETVSYGELAILAGHPGAARAVGGALARCRVAPVVPCHRIIRADGAIGGWGSDPGTKRWLLERERPGA